MASEGDSGELDLRGYLAVVRRRKALIIIAVLLVVASSLAASSLQTPVYQASAEVLLQARTSEQIFSPAAVAPATRVKTEIAVMQSRSVQKAVAKELGREATVAVAPMEGTDVVVLTAESTAPAEAARVANVYAETYIATRRQQLIDDLLAAGEQVKAKVDEIDRQIGDEDASRQAGLQTRRESYAEQLDQLQLARNLTETGGAQIVSQADQPTSPVRPTPLRNAAVALVVGLMLGVALAFLREYLDDTVKTKDDLQRATEGLTVLGLIPTVASWKDRKTPQVVSDTDPKSAAAEAYRSLRTSVQFIGLERPVTVIQLTSPNPSEGKTTTLANLAVALASAGQRVIVVCCDLRRPRIHEFFGLSNSVGFTSVLLGDTPLSAALQRVPRQSGLSMLASGPVPPNPSE
ncbi:MAG: YveK family protein, partial [Acidimicrobiales bacterium]